MKQVNIPFGRLSTKQKGKSTCPLFKAPCNADCAWYCDNFEGCVLIGHLMFFIGLLTTVGMNISRPKE
jgi:hypothetical protein